MPSPDVTGLTTAESQVAAQSTVLRRELSLADLALAQILIVIVPEFFGTAVKAGPSHVVLWLLAILLFFVPQALVVAHLNRLMPLEGGLYEWARLAFGDRLGFLVAWNMWLNTTVQVSQIALVTTTYIAYAAGPSGEWIASSPLLLVGGSIALIAGMMVVARLGLSVGKWVSNTGSIFTVLILGVLIALPFFHVHHGSLPPYNPLPLVLPPFTFFSLSVFSKMTFGALSGFELIAIFAGESRNPGRNLARSILFTAPLIALLYILGTSAILAFVSPDAIDVIGPIPQALSRGLGVFGFAGPLVSIAILLLLLNYICSYTLYFSSNTRLPLVAGWDHLLPRWFTVLHSKYRTPVNSILFMGGVALAASTAVLIGARNQEAFSLLQIWAWTFYGMAYLALFAIPLFSPKAKGLRPGLWLRIGAAAAFAVTLLFVLLSVSPVIEVASVWKYSLKIALVVLGANSVGWMIYRAGPSKSTLQENGRLT
ncbi:MAG: APC family permease [Candidatus Sulfotelmatobacter sp.]